MQLSKKQKHLSEFFALIRKCATNFEHFQTADDPHSLRISEIISCQKCG